MSDYQNIIEQSIHSIVDMAYKLGYQNGQKAVENEKYSTHTYWYQKGYEEGKTELSEEEVNNLMSDLQKGDDLTEKESETGCTDKKCPFYLNPDCTRCKECEEKRKAGIMTPVEIARLVAGEYDKHDTEQDKVTQWINDNADFIKEMTRMLEENDNRERSTDNREND